MSLERHRITCDVPLCLSAPTATCMCRRCEREKEPQEQFHACNDHRPEVAAKHRRIRGRKIEWVKDLP